MEQHIHSFPLWLIAIIIIKIWDFAWKIFALLKAARNNHTAWFVFILIFNTAGILPIIYLFIQRKIDRMQSSIKIEDQ
ncbi:MAG: hypothetical protein A2V46_04085 [Bacteroidetes bacterium RBG_19FT_COMBO_42_7]|nr:MAG: hypothetical protein A2V46_04085 [Bacteroidetes bacterium RBG_19FT_COMBO_42_7]